MPDLATPSAGGGLVTQLMDLQRDAGNAAVAELLQRQPTPQPKDTPAAKPIAGSPSGAGATGAGAAKPGTTTPTGTAGAPAEKNPLSDTRIAWIENLPSTIKFSMDKMGDDKLGPRIRKIDESLANQRAAIDAAKTADDKKALTEKMASSDDMKAKQEIDKVYGNSWAVNRLALMDYLGCTLGGDAGVERYYKSLVQFGDKELFVHPEAARRLIRVRDELAKEKVPMPTTDNGFALRGRHVHPSAEDKHPGMMTHSLGVAIDWEAYKNVHILDEQLMHLISAVTGRPHNLELPPDAMQTIVALGEQSMGNKLSEAQTKQVAKGDALIEKVGKSYDDLEKDSDTFRDSLKKDDILNLHREINPLIGAVSDAVEGVAKAQAALARAQRAKGKDKDTKVAAAQAALAKAQESLVKAQATHDKKMADSRKRLEELFKPWLDALKKAQDETVKEAEPMLKGKKLQEVMTDVGLKSRSAAVAAGTSAAESDLTKLLAELRGGKGVKGKGSLAATQDLRTRIAAAQAYLAGKSVPETEKTEWAPKLADLEKRAAEVVGRGTVVASEASVLRGAGPIVPAAAPSAKAAKPKWDKDFPAWEAEIAKHEAAMGTAEATLKTATGKVPKEAVTEAYKLRDDRAANEEIRKLAGKENFAKLQDLKARLWHQERASERLLTDSSFMFQSADVRNPGVAQLTGVLDVNSKGKKAYLGGGGFFGTPTRDKEKAEAVREKAKAEGKEVDIKKLSTQSGFGKRFFQTMVKYGFEPAAHWRTADSMHFQVRGLVDAVVPADACVEPPKGEEERVKAAIEKAKNEKEKAKLEGQLEDVAEAREKAVKHKTAGEEFSKSAETARKTWAAEGGNK